MMEGIDSKVPARLKEVFDNFYSSIQQDMQKDDEAVANAAKDQDNPDADSTQSS